MDSQRASSGKETRRCLSERLSRIHLHEEPLIDPNTGESVPWLTAIERAGDVVQYAVDDIAKVVRIHPKEFTDPVRSFGTREYPPHIQRSTYLGRTCIVRPVRGGIARGEAWRDEASGAMLFSRIEMVHRGQRQIRTVRATQFVAGVEPDARYFDPPQVKADYRVEDFRN